MSILTLSLADTEQFGIMRLIVRDWETARKALEEAGNVVNVTEVVAIEVEDRPGGLAKLLTAIEGEQINIEYIYAFTFRREDRAVIVFRFEDPDAAITALQAKGISPVDQVELFERAEQ